MISRRQSSEYSMAEQSKLVRADDHLVRRAAALLYLGAGVDAVDVCWQFAITSCGGYNPLIPASVALTSAMAAYLVRTRKPAAAVLALWVFVLHFVLVRDRITPFGPDEILAGASIIIRGTSVMLLVVAHLRTVPLRGVPQS